MQKNKKKTTTTTPRYRLYYTVETNEGDLYPKLSQISGKVNNKERTVVFLLS